MTKDMPRPTLFCSFCLKSDRQVARLVGGPSVYICDACIITCNSILNARHGRAAPDFAGWDAYTNEELLASLAPSEATLSAVRDDLRAKVAILRDRGISWAAIGEALGISRQAAWERFRSIA
jgi:ClpX C4-type zinc finger protein/Homeodomain-like domain-containing protein